jgi:protein CpxP
MQAADNRKEQHMNVHMNSQGTTGSRSRPWRRVALAALVGGLMAGAGAQAFAHGGPFGGMGGRGGWGMGPGGAADLDPAAMQRRAEAMVKFWLADVDASEAQQKRIAEIMSATMKELVPLREKHREARRQAIEALAKPQVDRSALEALRAQQLQLADQVSRRMTQSIADVAEVLTPEQRAKVAEKMQNRQERHARRGRS